jgi:coenzyme F420-reducing hydrogenase delta subunit
VEKIVEKDIELELIEQEFEPKIVAFLCKWCSSAGSDLAGVSRLQYPPNVIPITVMCSGSISPLYILSAFNKGADGVLISGCHPGDCHYMEGNYYARRRIGILKNLMEYVGLEPQRFQMAWVSASEGAKYAQMITEIVEELKPLGPQSKLAMSSPHSSPGGPI